MDRTRDMRWKVSYTYDISAGFSQRTPLVLLDSNGRIILHHRQAGCVGVHWANLNQNKIQWSALMNMETSLSY